MTRMMNFTLAATTLLLAPLTMSVGAQQLDTRDKTIMAFSSSVELPGTRLEAGKYVFRLADTPQRNVIQVLTEDEKTILGQWLFVPAVRQDVTGETVVTFRETSATSTPAVQYWYYPGERNGKEFIYPKDQAMIIAARTGATVRTEDGPVGASAQTATSRPPAPAEQPAPSASAPSRSADAQVAAAPVRQPRTDAGPTYSDPRNDSSIRQESTLAQNDTARTELPSTASPLPLIGLVGALSLLGAAGIRAFRL